MIQPYHLVPSDEYGEALDEVRSSGLPDVDANVATLCRRARYTPQLAPSFIGDPDLKVVELHDPNGYSLVLCFTIDESRWCCVLEWVAARRHDPDFDPWE